MGASKFSIFSSFKAKDGVSPVFERITNKAGLLNKVFFKFNSTQNRFGSCFRATMDKANFLMSAFMGSFVFKKVQDFYNKCLSAAQIQLTAEQKLTQVMKNNANIRMKGQDAYLSVTQTLFKMASDMQKKGVLGDEVLIGGMQTLGSMGFDDNVIKKIMPSIADLIVQQKGYNASVEDAENISKGLGRALAGNSGALSRMGIVLDKNQKKQFATMNTMQRTSMIADLLKNRVGGLNEEFAKTSQGIKVNFLNNFGDALEDIGKKLMPLEGTIFRNLNKILPKLVPTFDKIFNALKYGFRTMKPVFNEFNGLLKYLSQTLIPWLSEQTPTIKYIFENVFVPACELTIRGLKGVFKFVEILYNGCSNFCNFIKDNWLPVFMTIPAVIAGINYAIDMWRLKMALLRTEGGAMAMIMNTKVLKTFSLMTGAIWKSVVALKAQTLACIKAAAAFATTPVGMITIGITALIGVIWLLCKNWDKVKEIGGKAFSFLGETIKAFGVFIKDVFTNAYNFVKPFFDLIFNLVNPFGFIITNIPKIIETIKGIKNGGVKFEFLNKNNNSNFYAPEPKINGNNKNGNIKVDVSLSNNTNLKANVLTSLQSSNNLQLKPA